MIRTNHTGLPTAREVKASFCEQKEAKKLFCPWAMGDAAANAHNPA
ncbi:hypothetical protein [Acidocella sp.]